MQDILSLLYDEIPRHSSDTGDEHRVYRQAAHAAFEANRMESTHGAKPIVKIIKRGASHPHVHGYRHPDR